MLKIDLNLHTTEELLDELHKLSTAAISCRLEDDKVFIYKHNIDRIIKHLKERTKSIEDALRDIVDCPRDLDPATVPSTGIDSAPEQVVYNVSCGYLRIKRAKQLLRIKDQLEV